MRYAEGRLSRLAWATLFAFTMLPMVLPGTCRLLRTLRLRLGPVCGVSPAAG